MNDVALKDRQPRERHEAHATKAHHNYPKDPWEVVIDVFLNSADPIDFDIQTCLPCEWKDGDHNPQINFYNDGRPGFKLTFRLFDNTNGGIGSGYRFPNDKDDAVWSQFGQTCPTSRICEVFNNPVVRDATTLVVCNANPSPAQGEFQYRLNVSTDGNEPFVGLDPGGNNMNGSTK